MKLVSMNAVNELIESLKAQRAELLEDKTYMLDRYQFDCAEDEFEYDLVCSEIEEIEKIIDNLYKTINHPQTVITNGIMFYVEDIK